MKNSLLIIVLAVGLGLVVNRSLRSSCLAEREGTPSEAKLVRTLVDDCISQRSV